MYLYIEMWRAKKAWRDMPKAKRGAYMRGIMQGMEGTKTAGAELVAFALNEPDTPSRADYTYIAAWRMRDRSTALTQDNYFVKSGWLDYFDQVNARGKAITEEEMIRHHIMG